MQSAKSAISNLLYGSSVSTNDNHSLTARGLSSRTISNTYIKLIEDDNSFIWYTMLLIQTTNMTEPVHEKTNNLHRRKQSRRSASR